MILSVENGAFSYGKGGKIFENVSFSAGSGELMAILGPNGAGKTTLLRCIMGMLRWSAGGSALDGEDIRSMSAKRLWSRIAYVPQARTASGAFTVLETVLIGRTGRLGAFSAPGREDVAAAREALESLGIEALADRKCSQLSGGELQMVLIARALAAKPQLLILDEPESNLDFKNQLIVLNAMSALAQRGMTIVFNTHYPAHALQRADKSLILSRGGDCVFGETGRVLTQENIRSAFGVEAVIGEIETENRVFQNVIPLSLSPDDSAAPVSADRRCIASVTIISDSNAASDKINALLHEYNSLLIGRMGLPYRECGLYIINVTLDGSHSAILALSQRLAVIPGISVKTTFARGDFEEASI